MRQYGGAIKASEAQCKMQERMAQWDMQNSGFVSMVMQVRHSGDPKEELQPPSPTWKTK